MNKFVEFLAFIYFFIIIAFFVTVLLIIQLCITTISDFVTYMENAFMTLFTAIETDVVEFFTVVLIPDATEVINDTISYLDKNF